jgi:hypothetical protein
MSRLNPPRSSIVARLRQSDAHLPNIQKPRTFRRKLAIKFAAFARWVHIYVSMFGLAAVLFFSVTGITLNHPTWLSGETQRRATTKGQVELKWLRAPVASGSSAAAADVDPARQVDQLAVVEFLRNAHGIHGAVAEFRVEEDECLVAFKGPGYAADVFIDRRSGEYTLTQTFHSLIAILNDLHKGRDTGKAWSWVIDISAILMTLISITGLILLFYLKLRRVPGTILLVVGAVVILAAYFFGVP